MDRELSNQELFKRFSLAPGYSPSQKSLKPIPHEWFSA
jgi:hypothetical protein